MYASDLTKLSTCRFCRFFQSVVRSIGNGRDGYQLNAEWYYGKPACIRILYADELYQHRFLLYAKQPV